MQRYGELDDTEPGSDVAARTRTDVDQPVTNLPRDEPQLVPRERPEVHRRIDAFEYGHDENLVGSWERRVGRAREARLIATIRPGAYSGVAYRAECRAMIVAPPRSAPGCPVPA